MELPDRRPTLVALPEELLVSIAGEADWDDVLRLRKVSSFIATIWIELNIPQTCRIFALVSYSQVVWRSIFVRYAETGVLPKPFFLPKPLEECPASEIEGALTRWHGRWKQTHSINEIERRISPEIDVSSARTGLIVQTLRWMPGGRWLLAGFADGSIRYFDFEDGASGDLYPQLLIPTPFAEGQAGTDGSVIGMQLSFDFTSDIASASPIGGYHLTQFNLGVFYMNLSEIQDDTPVRVWRVRVMFEAIRDSCGQSTRQAVGLKVAECLSSFQEKRPVRLHLCHLQGSMIAYYTEYFHQVGIVLVNWMQANGKAKDGGIKRWYGTRVFAAVGRAIFPIWTAIANIPLGHVFLTQQSHACSATQHRWRH